MEGIHGRYPSPLFFFHLSMGIIHHLFNPKSGLDGLEGKRGIVKKNYKKKKKKKKKKPYHGQVPLQFEEDLMLPHRLEVNHIFGQQQGLFHRVCHIPICALLEVSNGGVTK